MSTDSQYLQSVLHSDIPLTREMGLGSPPPRHGARRRRRSA